LPQVVLRTAPRRAVIIAKWYFCVHGGISPKLQMIDDIHKEFAR